MNRYIKQQNYPFLLSQIFICFLAIISNNVEVNIILSIFQLILGHIMFKIDKGQWVSFSTLFITLSYILHMGNLFVTRIFGYSNTFLSSFEDRVINNSILFVILCHTALIIGSIIQCKKKIRMKSIIKLKIDNNKLEEIGWICTIIGVGPRVYIDINQIMLQINGNYLNSLSKITQYGWKSILAQFFYVGILILLFASKKNKWRGKFIFILVCMWELITMLSGGRIYAISFMMAMIYIYCVRIKMPKIKTVIIFSIILYFIAIILTVIAQIRTNGAFSFSSLQTTIWKSMGNMNPIFDILCEMGATMKTVIYSLMNFPSYSDYGYGMSYIDSILSISSFYESKIADINHMVYIYNFQNHSYMGGSWIGETFYNFSWLGCIYGYFFGRIIGSFERVFRSNEENNNYIGTLIILTFLFYIVTYSRDYFYRFNTTIQVCMVILFISYLLSNIKFGIKSRSKNYG